MKITAHEVIKSGERELIDSITADLDWESIEDIFSREHKLKIEDNVEFKKGDIVVYNNQIAYKLEFDVNIVLSVLLDREGNYLTVTSSGDLAAADDNDQAGPLIEPQEEMEVEESVDEKMPSPDELIADANGDENALSPHTDDPQEKISELASRAGEVISQLDIEAPVGNEEARAGADEAQASIEVE